MFSLFRCVPVHLRYRQYIVNIGIGGGDAIHNTNIEECEIEKKKTEQEERQNFVVFF